MENSSDAMSPSLSVAEEIERLFDDDPVERPGRFFHHRIESSARSAVLHSVFFDSDPRWRSAFVVMLALSGGIATLGLSQDSAATVIGSMIVAPLAAPMVGLGGAIASVWLRQSIRMLGVVAGGALLVIGVAFVVGIGLPDVTPTAQILARTNPDLRDLGVALLAGAAGAYARTRPSMSSSLVGVAIAVALVPPLAVVGLMLEESRWTLALGGLTLFLANLVGITLSAVVVLLVTGFVPLPRLGIRGIGLALSAAVVVAATVAIAAPLSVTYRQATRTSRAQTSVYAQAADTIRKTGSSSNISKIDVNGDQVTIDVPDPTSAPTAAQFESDLVDEVGPNVSVTVK